MFSQMKKNVLAISFLHVKINSAEKGKAGKKLHSGYIAPELVHIDLSEKAACPKKIQGASQRGYSPVSASVKQDLWALGAIAFEVLTGYSLWQADHHGMCNESELFRLAEWSSETKAARSMLRSIFPPFFCTLASSELHLFFLG